MTVHYLCRWQSITPCSILHQLLKKKKKFPARKSPAAFTRFGHRSVFKPTSSRSVRPYKILWYIFQYYFPSTSRSPRWFLLPLRPSDWTVVCIPLLRHARCRKVKGNKITDGVRCGLFVSHTEQSVLRQARLCCFMRVMGESWSCPALLLSAWRSCFLKQFCSVARYSGF